LYFHAGGRLSFEPAKENSSYDEYVSDPNRPIPFVETQSTSVPQA
jgi:predicted acyl esterase